MLPIIGPWLERIEAWVKLRPARFLLIAFAINGAFIVAFDRFDQLPPDGPAIMDLHVSNSVDVFTQITEAWKPGGVVSARRVLRLDLLFPFAYSALLAGLYFLAIQGIRIEPRRLIVMAPFVAAVADWIENSLALVMLRTGPWSPGVLVMFAATIVKFSLIALTAGFIVAALMRRPAWLVIKTSRYTVLSLLIGTFPLFALGQGRDLLVSLSNTGAFWQGVLFVAWLVVWAFSTWYWSRVLMDAEGSASSFFTPEQQQEFDGWAMWLPRWIGALTLIVPGIAILADAKDADHGGGMVALGVACLACGGAFLWFVITRKQKFQAAAGKAATGYSRRALTTPLKWILRVSAAVSLTMFVLLTASAEFWGFSLGAAAILAIAAANTVFFGSVAVFWTKSYRVPVEILLIVAALTFSFWNDNHLIDITRPAGARATLAEAFDVWAANKTATSSGALPLVIVTAEGGGIRAAHWTSAVLHTLDDTPGLQFSDRLFAISSVSGSSFGAAVYAGLKKDTGGASQQLEPARKILQRKFLAPMVARLVTGDFAQWFIPVPIESFDRSAALEEGFERADEIGAGKNTMALPLASFRPTGDSKVPLLFFNSTSVRTGRRVVASSVSWWIDRQLPGAGPVDFHDWVAGDVPIATAVHNTARFPVISAAGLVRANGGGYLGHLVDGGYFENTGADTAIDVITHLRPLIGQRRIRFVVIEVANSAATEDETKSGWRSARFLGELLSPLRALLYAREARGTLATTRLRGMVDHYIAIRPCSLNPSQPQRSAPLGWQLSDEMVKLLYDAAGTCVGAQTQALQSALQ